MDWITLQLDRSGKALFRQLAARLVDAVGDGRLQPGERLPSERDLARLLCVSRTTVVNAYRELEARGLVRGHVGRGTFVCAGGEQTGAPFAWRGKLAAGAQRTLDPALRTLVRSVGTETISFGPGAPALDRFPVDLFGRLTSEVLRREPRTALALGPVEGQPRLREALAGRYDVRPEQVMVLTGAQQGLDLVARCLVDPGDAVVMDRPGYLGAIQTFRSAGAQLVGWDAERADLDELEDLLLRYRPKLLYTNPTYGNPTGRTLPLGTRRDLLRLAARYRLPIVEDEPYRDLYFGTPPPPSLHELDDRQLVIYLGTFSKTLAAGLRLGWLMAAEAIVEQLALIKARSDVFSAGLPQLVVAELLRRHHFDAHVANLRAEHAARYRAMADALQRHLPAGALAWRPMEGGLYLWCRLRHGLDSERLLQQGIGAGVTFVNGGSFYGDGAGRGELRLCFTTNRPAQLDIGVRRLAGLVVAAVDGYAWQDAGVQPVV